MASRGVVERALTDRIEELEAELRETKARYAALELKANEDAKKLADIASIVGNGIPGSYGASNTDSKHFESPTLAAEMSKVGDTLQVARSDRAHLVNDPEEENERTRQVAQAAAAQVAELTPTPVEKSAQLGSSEHHESSQDTETLASILSRRPEGISFPTLGLQPPVVRVTASVDGTLAGRSQFAGKKGFGDSAYKEYLG